MRGRPTYPGEHPVDPAWPSGHATCAGVWAGILLLAAVNFARPARVREV